MRIYEKAKHVPDNAKKIIRGGRLKGMTDINPMYRIKSLTELFGPCGIGWYVEMIERWTEKNEATGEVAAFVRLALYVKDGEEWSKPIEGEGGSMLIAKEAKGPYLSDEAWKMAKTDALSVCCKALGIGADVYWEADRTKYSAVPEQQAPAQIQQAQPQRPGVEGVTDAEIRTFRQLCANLGKDYKQVMIQAGWQPKTPWTAEMHGRALIILKDIENARAS
jgi:hypothetical protein